MLHCDHEGGNVSAFSSHTVASALSDPYYSVSAGLNGLAGPLHGLANQECLKFVLSVRDEFAGLPSKDQLKQYMIYTVLALAVLINTAIIYSPFIPQNIDLEVNDTALSTITAPRYIEFESRQDKIANKKTQNHIKNTIPPVYSINQTINSAIIENIINRFKSNTSINNCWYLLNRKTLI